MSQPTSRRAFLSGRMLREDPGAIRPPGAVESRFLDLCTACGDCLDACPEDVISLSAGGYPTLRMTDGACTFCGDCVEACQTGALIADRMADWPWRASIVASACLSLNGISCRLCQDSCDEGSIRFKLMPGGKAEPVLNTETCTGCGGCATSCPADAVRFERPATLHPETLQ